MQNHFLVIHPSLFVLKNHPSLKLSLVVESCALHLLIIRICLYVFLIFLLIDTILPIKRYLKYTPWHYPLSKSTVLYSIAEIVGPLSYLATGILSDFKVVSWFEVRFFSYHPETSPRTSSYLRIIAPRHLNNSLDACKSFSNIILQLAYLFLHHRLHHIIVPHTHTQTHTLDVQRKGGQ